MQVANTGFRSKPKQVLDVIKRHEEEDTPDKDQTYKGRRVLHCEGYWFASDLFKEDEQELPTIHDWQWQEVDNSQIHTDER